ncbi:hypothetical protein OHB54_09555 [Streptomyces sp. NBC_01007]|nr:hypothetical protein OHB54_09555 [Streptomyces sp. NBC_01007]
MKNVPGRPDTDKLDAVRPAKVAERGIFRASFVPFFRYADQTAQDVWTLRRIEWGPAGRGTALIEVLTGQFDERHGRLWTVMTC